MKRPVCFNEAAAAAAENLPGGGPRAAAGTRFNEAAAAAAENQGSPVQKSTSVCRASMRPRPRPRKTPAVPGGGPRAAAGFNEAAAAAAENRTSMRARSAGTVSMLQ